MDIYKAQAPIAAKSSWFLSLLVMLLISIGVMIILQGLALFLIPPIFNISLDEMMGIFTAPSQNTQARMAMFFVQGLGSGLGFFIAAWFIAKLVDKVDFGWKQQMARFKFIGLLSLLAVMLGGILFNSLIIDWNAGIKLPEQLGSLENYLRNAEDQRMVMTKFLTDFESPIEFLVGLVVIGLLAGIGEEVLFRGVLQPKMQLYTGNIHVAVWLTAFIFSAIHMQFYGLFPRMLLGAIFGYLYFYSGSLLYPIIAHILNNSLTITLVYLGKLDVIDFDIEQTDQVSWPVAIIGLLLLLISLKYFKDKHSYNLSDEKLAEGV
ncbi:CPBP family intramembrane glutamic endopeptidase [Cecembia lonarensis]|uniref:CAAX amino terminal protease self-immunity n=1 Tax=Cecembia lonarensis (strain CCUG 58316 / KCTC 22772 / LW9) TaxID=1225176 RepID=K1L168_CECL9|nr:CPBP family intramembrane glutamic endopeptidase [Cecembia lonarensis]EKB50140.1 CAAX amino terminal protease self- immunity [Cecembia lonarensis LW9]